MSSMVVSTSSAGTLTMVIRVWRKHVVLSQEQRNLEQNQLLGGIGCPCSPAAGNSYCSHNLITCQQYGVLLLTHTCTHTAHNHTEEVKLETDERTSILCTLSIIARDTDVHSVEAGLVYKRDRLCNHVHVCAAELMVSTAGMH